MSVAPPPAPPHAQSSAEDDAFSVSAAKAFFEAAKRPEVQKTLIAASKNPLVRDAAVSAAKNPQVRNQVMTAMINNNTNSKPSPPPKYYDDEAKPPPPPPHRTPSKPVDYTPKPAAAPYKPPAPASYNKPSFNATQPVYPNIVSELQSLQLNKTSGGAKPAPAPPVAKVLPSTPRAVPSSGAPPTRPPPPKASSTANEPYALCTYTFNGSQFDEVSCQIGDFILLKKEVDDQWVYGQNTRTGQNGIVPLGFIDIKIPLPHSKSTGSSASSSKSAIALYDYYSGTPGDLTFKANDYINIVEWVNNDWIKGELRGSVGIFPSNYVDTSNLHLAQPTSYVSQPAQPLTVMYGHYDYHSGVAEDLIFAAGEQVEVLDYVGNDWIRGRCRGMEGLAPMTYLTSTPTKANNSPKGLASIATIGTVKNMATATEDHQTSDTSNLYCSKGDRLIIVEDVDEYLYMCKLDEFKSLPAGLIPKRKVVLD